MNAGRRERGFTLLELIVAMAVFGLIGLALFGVLALGARSASSGERVTEQARRYRTANEVISRQVAGAAPVKLPHEEDDEEFKNPTSPKTDDTTDPDLDQTEDDDDDDGGDATRELLFLGDADALEFVTTSPQRPDASGMAIVRYWVEDGTLRMSERPVFTAYASDKKKRRGRGKDDDADTLATILLYDVESVTFSYQRESDSDEWLETWDATDEQNLPACVRIDVKPSAVGGPDFYHEIPVMVATFNQIEDQEDGD